MKIKSKKSKLLKKTSGDKKPLGLKKKKGLKKKEVIKNPFKKKKSEVNDDLGFSPSGWMVTGTDNIKKQIDRQKTKAAVNKRNPEFFLGDGEAKRIRFRSNEPICGIYRYSLRINGKWVSVTAPPPGQRDYAAEAGLRPAFKQVYEVIDRDGYTDKQGKKQKNVPKFFLVSAKVFEQLELIRSKLGNLTGRDITVMRSGSGINTTYSFMPEAPSKKDFSAVKSIAKDFAQGYAPLSEKEMRGIITDRDDEED